VDHGVADTLTALLEPVDELRHYPGNARVHNLDVLAESLASNGQYRPIVANRRDGFVLAGNGTLQAARELGWSHVAVTWVDVDEAAARRIVLVDNRANDLAGYDDGLLVDLLKAAQPDLSGTGFDQDTFDALVASLYEPASLTDPDTAPPLPAEPRSQAGDVWLLGEHRLACGDSTDPKVVASVVGSGLADCMWTDPPYGVDYNSAYRLDPEKAKNGKTIQNDGAAGLPVLLAGFLATAAAALRPGAPAYIAHPAGVKSLEFGGAVVAAGWSLRQQLVWVKDVFVMGRSDYHYKHEPIWLAYTPGGEGRRGRGSDQWFGNNSQSSVFDVRRPKASAMHPTMKPTELIVRCINNSCPPGGVVLDPFGGSGSTLIAAHLTGRRARLVELDPSYADVICRRWQEHTGVLPVLEATGEPHDFTEDDTDG
jgi:DNA modification methylase